MKTLIEKMSIITVIGLVALVALSTQAARYQNHPKSQTEIGSVAPGNYGEVMNNLFGR